MSNSLQPHESQHTRPPCPSPTPRVHSDSRPLSQWSHPAISSSVTPFCPIFPIIRVSWRLASGGPRIGASTSASVLPMNIQDWFPLGWTGWISLQSKGLKNLLQHHGSKASILWHSSFLMVQVSHPYMTTGKTMSLTIQTFAGKGISLLFKVLSRFVIAFLPRSKCLLIS